MIDIVVPIFGLALIGYGAGRLGWFNDQNIKGLARFVFDWAVPALLIRTFSNTQIPSTIPWHFLSGFYLPAIGIYLLGIIIGLTLFRSTFKRAVIVGFCASFGNSVMLGIPLILLAFGEAGSVPFFILMSFHGLGYFMLTTILLTQAAVHRKQTGEGEPQEGSYISKLFLSLIKNPIILGLATGIFMNRMGWRLPGPVDQVAEYLQLAVTPCALFVLGASMTQYRIGQQFKQAMIIVFLKNFLFPISVWYLGSRVLALPDLWVAVSVVLAASPTGINTFLFADRFDVGRDLASTTILLSTLTSIVTLSLILSIYA